MSDTSNSNATTSAPEAASGATAASEAKTTPSGGGEGYTAATTVSSLADLKEKAPKVYEAMLQGLGMNIVNKMKDHQDKIKEMNRKARDDAEGKS